ncbi:hypothetical protein LIER_10937 [Lithospermum erythrorhizon]|uniref:CoA carboxyltransferase N-terminal domain-containing protein n=1 Tax=Lithospermum erythrorhizon TaxID=34254 RepID=A0AAV3PMY1_LITER
MVSLDPIEFHSEEEPYKDRIDSYQRKTGLADAVQTGTGQLQGIPVAIGVMDFLFMGGSMGSVVGEKLTRLIEHATEKSLPLIIVCASGGARMQEGSLSLMQMAKISAALYDYQSNKQLFYVAVLTSPTTGGVTASFGTLGDIIIAEPNAYIAFAGKRVIEQTLNKTVPDGSQEAEYLSIKYESTSDTTMNTVLYSRSINFGKSDRNGFNNLYGYSFPRVTVEEDAYIVHVKMLKETIQLLLTDSNRNKKFGASVEQIGREARGKGSKLVVVIVDGFVHIVSKRCKQFGGSEKAWRSKCTVVVYIEDTTRSPHNGCRLRKKFDILKVAEVDDDRQKETFHQEPLGDIGISCKAASLPSSPRERMMGVDGFTTVVS